MTAAAILQSPPCLTVIEHDPYPPLARSLCADLARATAECVVCCDAIKPRQPTFACPTCFAVHHWKCVREWAKSEANPKPDVWRCPTCNSDLPRGLPALASPRCMCGNAPHPMYPTRLLVPHTCGQRCGKSLGSSDDTKCTHSCALACHPGPCPPCDATIAVPCFGGHTFRPARCGSEAAKSSFACTAPCGRTLACGVHTCTAACHDGACSPCPQLETVPCACGKHAAQLPCGTLAAILAADESSATAAAWHCEDTCGIPYACGAHTCESVCHAHDATAKCPTDPARIAACPCGRTRATRTKCTDPVRRAHLGHLRVRRGNPVGCRAPSPASEPVTCETVCNGLLACKTHRCKRVCCPARPLARAAAATNRRGGRHRGGVTPVPGIDADLRAALEVMHECARACGKPLPCGTHNCAFPCHPGACPTCLESSFDDLVCHCGRSVIRAPVPCGTTHAPCSFPCIRVRQCGHPTVSFHACHPDSVPCPPCAVLVQRPCRCTGTALPVPCHRADVPACGERCARIMPCGHRCAKVCHAATEEQANESGAPLTDCECRDACGMRRSKSCGHACTAPCHPAEVSCEDAGPCGVQVRRACACGRRSELGPCKVGQNAVPVACDEACAVVARNKRLAAALLTSSSSRSSLHDPDDDEGEDLAETYPSDLLSLAARDLALVRDVESAWTELITHAATNPTLVATRFFPPMKSPKRALLHAYAPFWGLSAASHDPEPARCVAVTARHGVSRAPRVSLSAAVVAGPAPSISAVSAVPAAPAPTKRHVPVLANALIVERTPLARHADLAPYLRLFFGSARVAGVSTTPCGGEAALVDAVVRAEGVAPGELDALVRDRIAPALAALLVDLGKAAAVKAARTEGEGGWKKMGGGKGKGKPRLARTGSAASGNAFAVLDPDAQEPVEVKEEEVKVRDEDEVPTRWDEDDDEEEEVEGSRSVDGDQLADDQVASDADDDADRVPHPDTHGAREPLVVGNEAQGAVSTTAGDGDDE
ncbi:hypothetical protein AMAG_15844 [Allomyces macrogynus ATCC 38327]|uniref:R3H domain-containing protein n=1 Tax=Allomyces macrogynus (strain ATCC 38327) TaxID=578462 RepID=A0A0L0T8P9_ALLM3|nr:hypothetical protein AMAG_15844 [Allomyces macrogynus ATCC 38327]|eukprot:KNE71183.1 hypothetical protein AMAG_15844 [Allomyces macrogynus ATCC 38327]